MTTRIILHSRTEKLFISGAFNWSAFSAQAEAFSSARAAAEFARWHPLGTMELIVERANGPAWHIPRDRVSK